MMTQTAILPITIARYAISGAVLVAIIYLGFLAVKYRRKEHLYWIVPDAISRVLNLGLSLWGLSLGMRGGPINPQFVSTMYAMFFGSCVMGVFAMAALVVVIWKSLDHPSLAVDN